MAFAFAPACCCNGCNWFAWSEPLQSPSTFFAQVTKLAGSTYWTSSGPFVEYAASGSGGTIGQVLLAGAAGSQQYGVTINFQTLPGSDTDDSVIRIYLDTGSTPGSHYAEVRTGEAGYVKVVGTITKTLLFPFKPSAGSIFTACIQQEPNGSDQYYLTAAFFDNNSGSWNSVVTEALEPTQKQAILEMSGTADITVSGVTAWNHKSGTTVCDDCPQDCGCPNCTMTVTIDGVQNAGGGYTCAGTAGEVGESAQNNNAGVCSNANSQYLLPSEKAIYSGRLIAEADPGSTRCIWWQCFPLLTNQTACSLLVVVSMDYNPTSGVTTMHGGVHVLSGSCSACTDTGPCQYTPTDGWDVPLCCACSSMYYETLVNTGGARQNCGLLSEFTLDPIDSSSVQWVHVLAGSCCDLSGCTLTINSTDNQCAGTSDHPQIELTGGDEGQQIGCAAGIPIESNGTDYGVVQVGTSVEHTFTIHNIGDETLLISPALISGSPDFTIGSNVGTTTITPGSSTTLTVVYAPTEPTLDPPESDRAWIEFSSNAFAQNTCWFEVSGQPTSGTIGVQGNSHTINNACTNSPETTNDTDFGTVALGSGQTETYTITNSGSNDLSLGVVSVTGADSGDFQVVAQPGSTLLSPSGSTTFQVEFAPLLTGTRTAAINIPNSDWVSGGGNPFKFCVTGDGTGTNPTNPPEACPYSSGDVATFTLIGGPACGFPDGTYSLPWTGGGGPPDSDTTSCVFAQNFNVGDDYFTITALVTYWYDADSNPATFVLVQVGAEAGDSLSAPSWGASLGFAPDGITIGDPGVFSGWLTAIGGLSLGGAVTDGCSPIGSCCPAYASMTGSISIS